MNPPTILFSVLHNDLLFLAPSSSDVEPLFVLEFLHRLTDVLEEFLGPPLLASKIQNTYDVVAQLLGEMVDAGTVCQTEPNALRDVVSTPGWIDKLLGGVGLPGGPPALSGPGAGLKQQLSLKNPNSGPAIPWRRANVRHTSNELYVDIIETLTVTLAPSGRPLAALARGSILFTAKISGVPDLVLTLAAPGGKHTLGTLLEAPTFHPCVRLARWRERPGELSFVPPDGHFLLAGYDVDLLPGPDVLAKSARNLNLPVLVEVDTALGPAGLDFEVRLTFSQLLSSSGASSIGSTSQPSMGRPGLGSGGIGSRSGSGRSTPSFFGAPAATSASPQLHDVLVNVPVPRGVRGMAELRASRGEAAFLPTEYMVEWRIPNREIAEASGVATLRATVVGPLDNEDGPRSGFDAANGELYDEEVDGYQVDGEAATPRKAPKEKEASQEADKDAKKAEQNAALMPRSAALSFSVKGWLPSGLRVDSLVVDPRKSRGLGEGVKPIKGAKYLTVSRKGVETRC